MNQALVVIPTRINLENTFESFPEPETWALALFVKSRNIVLNKIIINFYFLFLLLRMVIFKQ